MVAYVNNRYGRWLPDFWAMLTALPVDQVALFRTDFTEFITGNPYSNMAWDMWIECTMNKGSNMKSGWLSILQNEKQLLVHSRNVNNVSWPIEKMPRGSIWNAAQNGCEKMSSACRTWSHACKSLTPSRSTGLTHRPQHTMPASAKLVAYFSSARSAGGIVQFLARAGVL